jgi:hypothetical protein
MAVAYWGEKERSTQRQVQRYRSALATVSAQSVFMCVMSHEAELVWGVWYGLLARRMAGAAVHLVVTHYRLYVRLLALLAELACPPQFATMAHMLLPQVLPLEYLYLALDLPPATHVWCDDVCWAVVLGLRPHALRWTATGGSAWVVDAECGYFRAATG